MLEQEKQAVAHYLNYFEDIITLRLAASVCRGAIKRCVSKQEALEVILSQGKSAYDVMVLRRNPTSALLKYLCAHGVQTSPSMSKAQLLVLLFKLWNIPLSSSIVPSSLSSPSSSSAIVPHANQMTTTSNLLSDELKSQELVKEFNSMLYDEFTVAFAKHFYDLFNKLSCENDEQALNNSHFYEDCTMNLKILGQADEILEETVGYKNVIKLLYNTKLTHQLYFHPNLSTEGVRGKSDLHGISCVVAFGTLHQGPERMVGVFEQSFVLRENPLMQRSFKICSTTLVLRSQNSCGSVYKLLSFNTKSNGNIGNIGNMGNMLPAIDNSAVRNNRQITSSNYLPQSEMPSITEM